MMLNRLLPIGLVFFILFGCSGEDDSKEDVKLGSIEIIMKYSNGEPVTDATITTLPVTKTSSANDEGVAILDQIKIGEYEVYVALPSFSESVYSTNVTVTENKSILLNLNIPVLEEKLLPLSFYLDHAYRGLLKIFDANDFVKYWGDTGCDILMANNYQEADPYNLSPNDNLVAQVWEKHYVAIRAVNSGLDAIADNDYEAEMSVDVVQAEGELRFLRAVFYYNLIKIYGNPVVVTSAKYNLDNPTVYGQGMLPVYELIIDDLILAEQNLSASTDSRVASIGAAQALLGKIYLQMAGYPLLQEDKYDLALQQFKKVKDNYTLETEYANIFDSGNTNSREVLFRVDFDGTNDASGGNYGVYWGPLGIAKQDLLSFIPGYVQDYSNPGSNFVEPVADPIEVDDQRFYTNVATFTISNGDLLHSGSMTDWRPYKWMKPKNQTVEYNSESFDYPYLRYADVLLMLAEAENAVNGPTDIAYEAVNEVRRRAFGNLEHDLPSGLDSQAFLEAILLERKLELCYEGHRRDDLIRNQKLEEVIQQFNTENPSDSWDFQLHEVIWPIPQIELELNQNAVQNPGY